MPPLALLRNTARIVSAVVTGLAVSVVSSGVDVGGVESVGFFDMANHAGSLGAAV